VKAKVTQGTVDRAKIIVGLNTCGIASGAREVFDYFDQTVKEKNLDIIFVFDSKYRFWECAGINTIKWNCNT